MPKVQPDECFSIEVLTSIEAALPAWRVFEQQALGTLYQNSVWCRAWTETAGQGFNVTPHIIIARNSDHRIEFILPLQLRRRQGIKVLEWLGAPHHNYGFGIFDRDFMPDAPSWFEANWDRVLAGVGAFDAIALTEMPNQLFGFDNPLRGIANFRAANLSFAMHLSRDFEPIYTQKKSTERRRAARKHEKGLAQAGQVGFGLPDGKAACRTLIDVMFKQQEGRLAELGIHGVFGARERQFVHRLAELQDEDDPILAPYNLTCDGEVIAVMMGGLHANCYWALISSLASGPLRKYSPGDIALRRTIEACCQRGLTTFDFSAGESSYKRAWADDVIHMSVVLRGRNLHGLLWAGTMALSIWAKRNVKRSPVLLSLMRSVRQITLGRRS